ncbi:MAG: hypothetical protein Q9170_007794 [Blastenia crenularia]
MQKPQHPPDIGNADRSGGILATSILALVLVLIFIALRFATRIWLVKRVGWDDWCIVFAGFGHIIGMGLIAKQIGYGFGRPAYYLTEHGLQEFMKYAYGEWLQTFATLTFTKISICLLLLRITITKAFIIPLYAAIGILAVSNVILSLCWIFQCTPHLDKAWNTKMPGHCFSKGQLERIIISQAIISIISDYFLSAFPIFILRKVQISFRSKVGLCLLMGLGVITGSLSLVRTILNYQNVTNDPTWLSNPNWYWRTWEVLFGVAAACIPTLRPGYKWLIQKLQSQSSYQRLLSTFTIRRKASKASTNNEKGGSTKSKPLPAIPSKDSGMSSKNSTLRPEDALPLQNFEGSLGSDSKGEKGDVSEAFKPGLHIHGDLSTNRPVHFKRWDSEARIGGDHGIAIIGAGPSGLVAAKYLLAENKSFDITIFEQRDSVGGLWHYTPLSPKAQQPLNGHTNGSTDTAMDIITQELSKLNTPMYEDLESNLPLAVMQFSDAPFPKSTQLFAKQELVLQYIRDYAEDLRSLIHLEHFVEEVRKADNRWEITIRAKGAHTVAKQQFDAVIVAVNGHTDWPLLPPIEGLDEWTKAYPDSVFHSVSYKNAQAFKNKVSSSQPALFVNPSSSTNLSLYLTLFQRTLLVGVGPSGSDISRQIGSVSAHPVLVAQRETSPYYTPQSYTKELPGLISLSSSTRSAKFEDRTVENDIDAIMFCTGYAYTLPLVKDVAKKIEEEALYQYIFRMETPTLAFMEMNEKIAPFPFAECQAAVLARVWSGRLSLPSVEEMEQWGKEIIEKRGVGRGFYALDPPADLEYMNEMYEWCCKAEGKDRGKMPKFWGKKEWWERMMAAEMKKEFNQRGEERGKVEGYKELGFRFGEGEG